MGKKDIGLKTYFQDTERYADLWNGGVFQGRQLVKAEELQEITPIHSRSDHGPVFEKVGDLVMKQNYDGQRFAVLALENQEKIDYGMPVRILIQEALEYDRQMKEIRRKNERAYKAYCEAESKEGLNPVYRDGGEYLYKFRKEDYLLPVATLVVYWGEKKWQGAKSLHEMIEFGDSQAATEFKKLVPEYPLHFLDLSTFKYFEYFRTELRPLLELFQKRNSWREFEKYIRENEKTWNMNDESWCMLSHLVDSPNIRKLLQQRKVEKEEEKSMCKALDDMVAYAKAEFVVDLLEEYGAMSEKAKMAILSETDISVLKNWHKLAAHTSSINEFISKSGLTV